jgi:endonuclease/exonuclease/phosphatase family metal-dependent hydrolase
MTRPNSNRLLTDSPKCRRSRHWLKVACVGLAAFAVAPFASARADDATVRIMTRNIYQGTNFQEILTATTPAEFVAAVSQIYNNILATKPAERAAAVAREIAREHPDLVGLQEVNLLRTGAALATNVVSDQIEALLAKLDDLRRPYEVVGIMPGLDVQAPSTLGFFVRSTYRTILIAPKGMLGSNLKLSNLQVQHFLVNSVFNTAVGVPLVNTRGWVSVDVELRGRSFRFITTHLEVAPPFSTQQTQAAELLATAANTIMPVILVADFNANASNNADPTFPTYQLLLSGGFKDAWKEKYPSLPGYTCCQNADLLNPTSLLSMRVDLILYRGCFSVRDIKIVGDKPSDRTPSGLWPSDHAGVVAGLRLPHGH